MFRGIVVQASDGSLRAAGLYYAFAMTRLCSRILPQEMYGML